MTAIWAKRKPRNAPTAFLSLADHSHDVAATFEALLDLPAPEARLAALAERSTLPGIWRARLCVLAFLHDFGKVNHKFQRGEGGHIHEAMFPLDKTDTIAASGLVALADWAGDMRDVLVTILSHHGYPPEIRGDGMPEMARHWRALPSGDPLQAVAALVAEARGHWPDAFEPGGEPLPPQPAFWHGFLGLLQLADWLGSDDGDDAFHYAGNGDPRRRDFAIACAHRLLKPLGLDVSPLRAGRGTPGFDAVSPFEPSPIQRAVGEAAGRIVTMEAETGSGKTEAALYRFARLFMAGAVDGLYLALPTRVAATQMFSRVAEAIERLFPDPENRPVVVRAVPGDVGADKARIGPRPQGGDAFRDLPAFAVEWTDDSDEAEHRRRWAAERPKRFLAATIAVGTIDQALLGAVRAKHAQMRAACLSRSLLVVDEVHASDSYMTMLLANLLRQHLRAGGHALLLSATLGGEARTDLMPGAVLRAKEAKKLQPDFEAAVATPYPCVSVIEGNRLVSVPAASRGHRKSVEIEPLRVIAEPETIARTALAAAHAGARVLVIRNTVGDAIATRLALEDLAPGDPAQFTLNGLPTLHHGRFAREDRRLLDSVVEASLGKAARCDGGLVVVGTQTLEISLDIDADLLVTDLAPIDVLLQRIGRLHRHDRPRPSGFETPRCIVLAPFDFDAALATVNREHMSGPHGLGSVYDNLPALAATLRLVGDGTRWEIPAMNRALVEAATHSQRLEALVAELATADLRWKAAAGRAFGRDLAQKGAARNVMLRWDKPVCEFTVDESATSRLGTRNLELRFEPPLTGAFGVPVTRLVVPEHLNPARAMAADEIMQGENGLTLRLGENVLIYDALGLRKREPLS